jgi:glycine cleavage system H protein
LECNGCLFPDDLLYSDDVELWFRPEKDVYVAGMTSAVLWTAGKAANVTLKKKGGIVERGKGLATIESTKYFGSLRVPFDCRIVEVNTSLAQGLLTPASIYGDSWLAVVEPLVRDESRTRLLNGLYAHALFEEKVSSLHLKCFSELPDTEMLEIGTECNAVLTRLNSEFSSRKQGYVIHLVTDDTTSPIEMIRWSDESGNKIVERKKIDNLFHFILMKS